ncbi:hypothetical protein PRNP1_005014 [Phytophthora ramorum]
MFSSPFERMMKVLHYKSVAFIPFPMVAAGALNNVMWIVYCPMISSWFLFGGDRGVNAKRKESPVYNSVLTENKGSLDATSRV